MKIPMEIPMGIQWKNLFRSSYDIVKLSQTKKYQQKDIDAWAFIFRKHV